MASTPLVSRDLDAAREAFKHGDLEASRAAHAQQEAHQTEEGAYAKSVIFGALDGMLTGFAVVCATDGGGLSWEVVPTVGVASVLAGAISMGVGEYLGSIAETEHALEERKREKWELSSNPDGEKREMVEIFAGKGMSVSDATSVIDTLAKYEDLFLEIMLKHELGLDTPDDDADLDALKQGGVMFGAFFFFGVVPLLPYLYAKLRGGEVPGAFAYASALTALELFAMGASKSALSHRHWAATGLESLLLGGLAAAAAWLAASAF